MPPRTRRSRYSSSCNVFRNMLTPKILFFTLIISIALSLQSKEEAHCYVCAGAKVIIKTVCGFMDIFIIPIRTVLETFVNTKTKINTLLEAVRSKSSKTAFDFPDERKNDGVDIKHSIGPNSSQNRRKTLTIEENKEQITRRESRREPGTSKDEGTKDSKAEMIEFRPSRTKPIPSFVVMTRLSNSVHDIANEMKRQETTEADDKNIQESEEEISKETEQFQGSRNQLKSSWRSESLDGPRELFELTMPVPIYAEDGALLGYDDGNNGIMQYDPEFGGYYVDVNGEVVPIDSDDKRFQTDTSPGNSKHDPGSPKDWDYKQKLTLTDIEEWAAACDCTDEDEPKIQPTMSAETCVSCNCTESKESKRLTSTLSGIQWGPECKCDDPSKLTVCVKSIQTLEEIKADSGTNPQSEQKEVTNSEPQLEEKYTGPWRSESLDGPKQFYKGEGGGFTKEEEEEYFLREGKCSHYDDNKCKRCRCYRQKFTRDQFNIQANKYKGCLVNTGIKRKQKDSVRLIKDFGRTFEIVPKTCKSLEQTSTGSKIPSSELKSIKSFGQSVFGSDEDRCHCNSNTSEYFKSTDCRCPSTDSKHKSRISYHSSSEDRCRCFDTSKSSARLNEMFKGDDCKCSNGNSKLKSLDSQRSTTDRCICLEPSDSKYIKSENSFINNIRCHCHNESDTKHVKSDTLYTSKDCKCAGSNSKQTSAFSQSLANDNRCHCQDITDTRRVKSEILHKSKDCKCPSKESKFKMPALGRSTKDERCRCGDASALIYKKSKDCSCPTTDAKLLSSPDYKQDDNHQITTERDPSCTLCCDSKDSKAPDAESNTNSKPKIYPKLSNRDLTSNHKKVDIKETIISRPVPQRLTKRYKNPDKEFARLRDAKRKLIEECNKDTQIGQSLDELAKQTKKAKNCKSCYEKTR